MRLLHSAAFLVLFAQSALAVERSAMFSVSNMTCALCPITVKSALSRVPGVIAVEVDQDLARATVRYDDTQVTADAIAAASTNAGYPAVVMQTQ